MQDVGNIVSYSEGKPINVYIRRDTRDDEMALILVPRQWVGRGLLGCHIVPC